MRSLTHGTERRGHGARRVTALLSLLVALVAVPGTAAAAEGDTTFKSCVNAAGNLGCSADPLLSGAYALTISPNGADAYAATFGNAIVQFKVNRGTGALTRVAGPDGCVKETPTAGDCQDGNGINTPTDVLISPDGRFAYVSSFNSNTISLYTRNTDTGKLTPIAAPAGCVSQGGAGGCTVGRGLTNLINLTFGPGADAGTMYSLGGQTTLGAIATFDRNSDTGLLTQKLLEAGCVNNGGAEGCDTGRALGGFVTDFGVSSDGLHLYAPASTAGGILIFDRIPGTGEINQKSGTQGCVTHDGSDGATAGRCVDGSADLLGTQSVLLDPSGKNVYALTSSGIVTSSRNTSTGLLTQTSCITESGSGGACADGVAVSSLWAGDFSADGRDLAVSDGNQNATFTTGGLRFLRRDPGTGALTQRNDPVRCTTQAGNGGACLTQGTMGGYGLVHWDPNDRFVYAAENTRSAVVSFERDFAPVCNNGAHNVPHNTSVQVQLSCTDRNGDPITYAITRAPSTGFTGNIDQATGRVFYGPFTGFQGGDSFDYQGNANGASSNVARVDVNVAGPSTPPPPPPNVPTLIASTVGNNWAAARTYTTVISLSAKRLPAGASVIVQCKTKKKSQQKSRCPYKKKSFKAPAGKNQVNLAKQFRKKKLPVGTKITITITAPGFIGKKFLYTIRNRKIPKLKLTCLTPGSTTKSVSCG